MKKVKYLRKQLTLEERYERDTQILEEFNNRGETGLSVSKIAMDHGITSVQVYNIVKNYNKNYEHIK